jgi:hypothetical protein
MKISLARNEIKSALRKNICLVSFEKVDGSVRTMRCTLLPDTVDKLVIQESDIAHDLGQNISKVPKKIRKENKNIINVVDVDANDWRSFRIDSINSFKICATAQN